MKPHERAGEFLDRRADRNASPARAGGTHRAGPRQMPIHLLAHRVHLLQHALGERTGQGRGAVGQDRQRRLDRVGQIRRLPARPLHGIVIAFEKHVDLIDQRLHFGRPYPLQRGVATAVQLCHRRAQVAQRRQPKADLRPDGAENAHTKDAE